MEKKKFWMKGLAYLYEFGPWGTPPFPKKLQSLPILHWKLLHFHLHFRIQLLSQIA